MDGTTATAYLLVALGVILALIFIYVNFSLEKKWFAAVPKDSPDFRRKHRLVGVLEIAIFSVGVVLAVAGFVILGTYHPLA